MRIRLKLMGMLRSKSPADGALELVDGGSISDVLRALDVAPDSVQVFTVNGNLQTDKEFKLSDNDELTIIPPVGGG